MVFHRPRLFLDQSAIEYRRVVATGKKSLAEFFICNDGDDVPVDPSPVLFFFVQITHPDHRVPIIRLPE